MESTIKKIRRPSVTSDVLRQLCEASPTGRIAIVEPAFISPDGSSEVFQEVFTCAGLVGIGKQKKLVRFSPHENMELILTRGYLPNSVIFMYLKKVTFPRKVGRGVYEKFCRKATSCSPPLGTEIGGLDEKVEDDESFYYRYGWN